MSFVHLRNHTGYSFLSGAMDIDSMLLKAQGFGMKSIAITDRNSMYGIVPFYKAALGYGIKPILGSVFIDSYGNALTLISLTREGYSNISSLLTRFNLSKGDGDIDGIEFLQSSPVDGIAVLTGGFDGKIWKLIQAGKIDQAKSILNQLRDSIPELYIEVQVNKRGSDKPVFDQLHSLSRSLGIPAVLTSSNNTVNRSDYTTMEILTAIKEHRRFGIKASGKYLKELFLKSAGTMKRLACGWDELVKNTLVIADKADVDLELGKFHLPEYPDAGPGGADEFLRMVCIANLGRYYSGPSRKRASTCLRNELEIIKNKGLSGYFLIVSDIIRYSRKNGIPVGPGRGSAASSIVSYLTGITTVDPIKFNLYFERFLNPERTQLPDIDIDFGHRERDRVFEYARKKYGLERVAHIATISHFGWRGSVRESAKVLGLSELEISRLTRFFPMYSHGTLQDIIDENPALQKMLKGNKKLLKIMEFSSRIFGLPRNPSIHASGFIISDQPLYNYAPLEYSENGEIIIQITKNEFEDFGLLKLDCLGLRYLSVIYDSVTEIFGSKFPHLVLEQIPLDDKAAFDMLSAGDGVGVFQLESGGIRDLLKKVKVRKFKDIYEVLALYRPGPLEGGMIPKYLKNRGKKKFHAVFDDAKFYSILKDTYGIIVFQEQVMKIA
ncbi:DNA polymerase III subunit alpha, partial [Candidatus Dependentiae bacterium]|nr:DNA polymerase III subunit alpha [Candidatus Dependentiae bacterium]